MRLLDAGELGARLVGVLVLAGVGGILVGERDLVSGSTR